MLIHLGLYMQHLLVVKRYIQPTSRQAPGQNWVTLWRGDRYMIYVYIYTYDICIYIYMIYIYDIYR